MSCWIDPKCHDTMQLSRALTGSSLFMKNAADWLNIIDPVQVEEPLHSQANISLVCEILCPKVNTDGTCFYHTEEVHRIYEKYLGKYSTHLIYINVTTISF